MSRPSIRYHSRAATWLLKGGLLMASLVSAASAGPQSEAPSVGFLDALRAPGPSLHPRGAHNLYDGLIGSWEGEVVDHLTDGTDRRQSAEFHFAWVLEGRAIQDLWIAPARPLRKAAPPADGNRYGTTLRVYDPEIDAWRITWINPVRGSENRLVGRRVGSQIVQTGADEDGRLIRWVFVEIRPDAFHWRGESSEDGGKTWLCETEFFGRRRPPASHPQIPGPSEQRHASWEWTDRLGLETLSLETTAGGVVARGSVLVALDGSLLRARYRIEHDAAWRFREAKVETGPLDAPRELHVRRLQDSRWEIDGVPRPDLDGCEDLDLMVTPYTNTPPLAAHALATGESRRLRVAWVRFPDLDVHAVEQEYTRLESSPGHARYRYRNLESGFIGELRVGDDGLVLEYGQWKRR